jgi:hypothetical protein
MDRIGSLADYSSEQGHGFMAVTDFTDTLTIAMIRVAGTMGRFRRVESSRSITFMRTRRGTGEVTLVMRAMMGAANTVPDLRAVMVVVGMVAAGAARV